VRCSVPDGFRLFQGVPSRPGSGPRSRRFKSSRPDHHPFNNLELILTGLRSPYFRTGGTRGYRKPGAGGLSKKIRRGHERRLGNLVRVSSALAHRARSSLP
jgi:hypothetical protein